jgi:hypothetical protein
MHARIYHTGILLRVFPASIFGGRSLKFAFFVVRRLHASSSYAFPGAEKTAALASEQGAAAAFLHTLSCNPWIVVLASISIYRSPHVSTVDRENLSSAVLIERRAFKIKEHCHPFYHHVGSTPRFLLLRH